MTVQFAALLADFDLQTVLRLSGALLLGAALGWDVRLRNGDADARRRQGLLAAVAFLAALGVTVAVQGIGFGVSRLVSGGFETAAGWIVPLAATALLVLAATTVRVLLRPARADGVVRSVRMRDAGFSVGFALALGLACGAGLPHVAIVIAPAGLLFLNLMRWTPPAPNAAPVA